jgi:hypothetical protein
LTASPSRELKAGKLSGQNGGSKQAEREKRDAILGQQIGLSPTGV